MTPRETPITSALLAVRRLPSLLLRRPQRSLDPDRPLLEQFLRDGSGCWRTRLEAIVVGAVSRLWKAAGSSPSAVPDRGEFAAFDEAGYAKAALTPQLRARLLQPAYLARLLAPEQNSDALLPHAAEGV